MLCVMKKRNDSCNSKFFVSTTPIPSPEFKAEIWVDGNKTQVYTGQDAIDVELGKIPVPKNSKIRIIDI